MSEPDRIIATRSRCPHGRYLGHPDTRSCKTCENYGPMDELDEQLAEWHSSHFGGDS